MKDLDQLLEEVLGDVFSPRNQADSGQAESPDQSIPISPHGILPAPWETATVPRPPVQLRDFSGGTVEIPLQPVQVKLPGSPTDQVMAPEPPTDGRLTKAVTAQRAAGESAGDWIDYAINRLPFVGGAWEAGTLGLAMNSARKIEAGQGTDDDYVRVADLIVDQERGADKSWTRKVVDLVTAMPGFMVEFGATGGAYRAGKLAALGAIRKGMQGQIRRIAAKTLAPAAGVLAQTAANPQLIARNVAQNLTRDLGLKENEAGDLELALSEDYDFKRAFIKAIPQSVVELGSERMGSLLDKPIEAIKGAVVRRWLKPGPQAGRTVSKLREILRDVGYHGVIGEMFEEELGRLAAPLYGDEYQPLGTRAEPAATKTEAFWNFMEDLSAEAVAFAIPGMSVKLAEFHQREQGQQKKEADLVKMIRELFPELKDSGAPSKTEASTTQTTPGEGAQPLPGAPVFQLLREEGLPEADVQALLTGQKTVEQVVLDNMGKAFSPVGWGRATQDLEGSFGHAEAWQAGVDQAVERITSILEQAKQPAQAPQTAQQLQLQKILSELFPHLPNVSVVATAEQLPEEVKQRLLEDGSKLNDIDAVYHNGQVIFNSAKFPVDQPQRILQKAVHEVAIHLGLRQALGPERFTSLAQSVWQGLTQEERDRIAKRNNIPATDISQIGEEWLAYEAERVATEGKTNPVWARVVSLVRTALRKMGITLRYSDVEIARLIAKGMQGAAATAPAVYPAGHPLASVDTIRFSYADVEKAKLEGTRTYVPETRGARIEDAFKAVKKMLYMEASTLSDLIPPETPWHQPQEGQSLIEYLRRYYSPEGRDLLRQTFAGDKPPAFVKDKAAWRQMKLEIAAVTKAGSPKIGRIFLAGNRKTGGVSWDFGLGTCLPTENCSVCYAKGASNPLATAKARTRHSIVTRLYPKEVGTKVGLYVKSQPKEEMPFLRINGAGDTTFDWQAEAVNAAIAVLDRPVHIFSRSHVSRAPGTIGLDSISNGRFDPADVENGVAVFKMGSVDAQLMDEYGIDFLRDNFAKRGIINSYLVKDVNDIPRLLELNRAGVFYVMHINTTQEVVRALNDAGLLGTTKNIDTGTGMVRPACPCALETGPFLNGCATCLVAGGPCFAMGSQIAMNERGELVPLAKLVAGQTIPPVGKLVEMSRVGAPKNSAPLTASVAARAYELAADDIDAKISKAERKGGNVVVQNPRDRTPILIAGTAVERKNAQKIAQDWRSYAAGLRSLVDAYKNATGFGQFVAARKLVEVQKEQEALTEGVAAMDRAAAKVTRASVTPDEPAPKQRKFGLQVAADQTLSPEVRLAGVQQKYTPISNQVTVEDAMALIQHAGPERALDMVIDENSGLPDRVRVTVGEALIKMHEAKGDHESSVRVVRWLSELGTRLGQGIQAFSIFKLLTPEGLVHYYRREVDRLRQARAAKAGYLPGQKLPPEVEAQLPKFDDAFAAKIMDMAAKANALPAGFQRDEAWLDILATIARHLGINKWDVGTALWYAFILSGWTTQARNLLGTLSHLLGEFGAHAVARPGSVPHLLAGLFNGIGRGTLDALNTLWTGKLTGTRIRKLEVPRVLELRPFKGPFRFLNGFKVVARLMAAADMALFRTAEEMRARYMARVLAKQEKLRGEALKQRMGELLHNTKTHLEQAKAQAKAEGLKGPRYRRRVFEIMEQNRPEELVADAADYGRFATYNQEPSGWLGHAARAISGFAKNVPAMRLLVPFTNVVANVTNNSLNYTPWGYTRLFNFHNSADELSPRYGTEAYRVQAARATLGTLGLAALYAATMAGGDDDDPLIDITAEGPSDPNRRRQLMETGWKPYSVKVGNTYIPYNYTALGIGMAMVGNLVDAVKWKKLDEADAFNRLYYTLLQAPKTVLSQSFLAGLADFLGALTQNTSPQSMTSFPGLARTASSFVVPNIAKQIDKLFDPTVYDSSTIDAALLRDVPIARQSLKPMLNVLGQPVQYNLNPFFSSKKGDQIWLTLARKGLKISLPSKTTMINDRTITPEEYYDYIAVSGPRIRARLEPRLTVIDGMDEETAQRYIDRIVRDERKRTKLELFGSK